MELRSMKYFVAVATTRNFTRAAAELSMAQSPLSHQIRKLERELGVTLLERTTRFVSLTPVGRLFYDRCVQVLAAADDAVDAVRRAAHGEMGTLTLGFVGSATYDLMPALVREHRRHNPDVELVLRSEMSTAQQVQAILDGNVTVGLLRPPIHAAEIVTELVRHEPLIAAVPTHHRLAARDAIDLEELADEEFVAVNESSNLFPLFVTACVQAGFTPDVRQSADAMSTLIALVAAGLGVAIVPESTRRLRMSGVTHLPLTSPLAYAPLALAYRADSVTALVRRYLDSARTVFRGTKAADSDIDGDAVGPYFDMF